jgi:hypothetical protein
VFALVRQKPTLKVEIVALAACAMPWACWSQVAVASDANVQQQLVAAADQLLQAVHAQGGLDALEDAPAILESIASAEAVVAQRMNVVEAGATGNAEPAWELEDELLKLAMQHPSDLRTVAIFREIGDKRWGRLENPAFLAWVCRTKSAVPPCASSKSITSNRGGRAYVRLEAMNLWSDAIRVFHLNRLYSSPELQPLERRLINHGGCGAVTRQSYTRLMAYNAVNSAPLLAQVMTLVEAADSDFVCSNDKLYSVQSAKARAAQKRGAIETYQKAYELLDRFNVEPATLADMFSPAVPVMLSQHPPVRSYAMPQAASSSAATGHIDVAFEITAQGRARKVTVLRETTNTAKAQERALVASIEAGLFRPRVTDGRIGDSRIVWRYYW